LDENKELKEETIIMEMDLVFEQYPEYAPSDIWIKDAGPQKTFITYFEILNILDSPEICWKSLEKEFDQLAVDLDIEPQKLNDSIKATIIGKYSTLPLYSTMRLLGKERLEKRMLAALRYLICSYS
jgi:hypothetical protein